MKVTVNGERVTVKMKQTKTKQKAKNMKAKIETVEQFIANVVKKNKDGEIPMAEVEKQFPQLPKAELLKQVKAIPTTLGRFVVGRHGSTSRFAFGTKATEKPVYTPREPRATRPAPATQTGTFALNVKLGENQLVSLPINLELVPA